MKNKIVIVMLLLFIFLLNNLIFAGQWDIGGWVWLESKNKIELWRKKEKEFISEALINITVPINCEILKGYSIKLKDDIDLYDYQYDNFPVGIWKIIYTGFDSSGNIYLKILREKNELNNKDISKLKDEILHISILTDMGENVIEKRLQLFDSFNPYLKQEGDVIIIDPSKIIIINGLNNIPPFKIEINKKHSVINISLANLE